MNLNNLTKINLKNSTKINLNNLKKRIHLNIFLKKFIKIN